MLVTYRECVAAVQAQLDAGKSLEAIFGELDEAKFRSSESIHDSGVQFCVKHRTGFCSACPPQTRSVSLARRICHYIES